MVLDSAVIETVLKQGYNSKDENNPYFRDGDNKKLWNIGKWLRKNSYACPIFARQDELKNGTYTYTIFFNVNQRIGGKYKLTYRIVADIVEIDVE